MSTWTCTPENTIKKKKKNWKETNEQTSSSLVTFILWEHVTATTTPCPPSHVTEGVWIRSNHFWPHLTHQHRLFLLSHRGCVTALTGRRPGLRFPLFRLRYLFCRIGFAGSAVSSACKGGRKQNRQLSSKRSVSAALIGPCHGCNIEAEGVIGNIHRPCSRGNSTCGTSLQCLAKTCFSVCENSREKYTWTRSSVDLKVTKEGRRGPATSSKLLTLQSEKHSVHLLCGLQSLQNAMGFFFGPYFILPKSFTKMGLVVSSQGSCWQASQKKRKKRKDNPNQTNQQHVCNSFYLFYI